jgi:ferritin
MAQLINENVNESLNLLVGKCFEANRILDRIMSQLSVKFVMNRTSDILHPLLAHAFLDIADIVSDYQGSRNCMTIYPETPKDDTNYSTVSDIFTKILNCMEDLENIICEVIDIAKEENDRMTKIFLEHFLLQLNPFTSQALLLMDKINMYGNDSKSLMDFDRNIKSFITLKQLTGKG